MNKVRDRAIVLIIVLIMMIGLISYNHYNMTNPTKINKIIANSLGTPANSAFTDQNFYNCVIDNYNAENITSLPYTTNLSNDQLQKIDALYCGSKQIISASGIELMINLTTLELYENKLIDMDLSKNVNLKNLDVSWNQLESLEVSNLTNLINLDLRGNQLESLDVSKNLNLESLNVSNNQLTSLDISNLTNLKTLSVSENQLENLDVSKNLNLESLNVANNQLTSLDVIKNLNLEGLGVAYNQLTSLDVSNNLNLEWLEVSNNQLTSLDVSKNSNLKHISTYNNQLTSLDISNNLNLEWLEVYNNQLTSLDVSKNINLAGLNIYNNQITSLDISKNLNLESLNVAYNQLTSLDVSKNVNLRTLEVYNNQLTSLDVSKNINLANLNIYNNQITSLDISKNIKLKSLIDGDNPYIFGAEIVYKNIELDLSEKINSDNYKLNDNFTKTYKYSTLNDIELENPVIKNENLGEYNYKLNFTHDKYVSVTGTYTVYVTELTSDKYIINNELGYIFLGSNMNSDKETILSNLKTTYGKIEINNNKVEIKDGEKIVKEFNILSLSSNKYKINFEKGYIYTGLDTDKETILSNLKTTYGTIEISDNKVQIKNETEVIKEFEILNLTSDDYELGSGYVYTGLEELNTSSINSKCGLNIKDNTLEVSYEGELLDTYKIIRITSKEYKITKEYIHLINKLDISKINITNGKINEKDNKLEIMTYDDRKIDDLEELKISFGDLKVINNKIVIKEEMKYNEFMNNISSEELTYDIYDNGILIHNGNIEEKMILKVKSETYGEIENYEITREYLDVSNLNINEKNIVLGFNINDTYEELLNKIETTGEIKIIDNSGKELTNYDIIKTGSKIKIELSTEVKEYTISVMGDVTGTGKITMADVMKTANYILDNNVIQEECYKLAADVTGDGSIKISDVMKLANYILKGSF